MRKRYPHNLFNPFDHVDCSMLEIADRRIITFIIYMKHDSICFYIGELYKKEFYYLISIRIRAMRGLAATTPHS